MKYRVLAGYKNENKGIYDLKSIPRYFYSPEKVVIYEIRDMETGQEIVPGSTKLEDNLVSSIEWKKDWEDCIEVVTVKGVGYSPRVAFGLFRDTVVPVPDNKDMDQSIINRKKLLLCR